MLRGGNTNNYFSIPKKQYIKGGRTLMGIGIIMLAMVNSLKVFTNQVL